MKTSFTIYRPGQEPVQGEADLPARPGFEELERVVQPYLDQERKRYSIDSLGPSWVEHVTVFHNGEAADMFVDEHGLSVGLPFNRAASAIYRAATLRRQPNADPERLPRIVGTAILFHRRVWF